MKVCVVVCDSYHLLVSEVFFADKEASQIPLNGFGCVGLVLLYSSWDHGAESVLMKTVLDHACCVMPDMPQLDVGIPDSLHPVEGLNLECGF